MKQPLTLARRRALRNLHGSREEKTLARLGEALNRMEAGSPQRIAAPFRWTKANLAREADVHITTILFKEENGSYRYAGILQRFEALRAKGTPPNADAPTCPPEDAQADPSQAIFEMEQELARQAGVICELRARVKDLQSHEADIHDLMEKNAGLREECRRLQGLLRRPA
jgi:hypothetical protein